jgi:hypothetical protein
MPMEDMGHDACVIVGYHNKVSVFIPNMQYFPKWKTLLAMWHNLREISLHFLSGNNRQQSFNEIRLNLVTTGKDCVDIGLFLTDNDLDN